MVKFIVHPVNKLFTNIYLLTLAHAYFSHYFLILKLFGFIEPPVVGENQQTKQKLSPLSVGNKLKPTGVSTLSIPSSWSAYNSQYSLAPWLIARWRNAFFGRVKDTDRTDRPSYMIRLTACRCRLDATTAFLVSFNLTN